MPGIKAKRKQLVRKTLMRAKAQSERPAEQRQESPEEYAQTEVQQGISDVAARTGNTAKSTARMSYRKFRAMQEKRKNLTLQRLRWVKYALRWAGVINLGSVMVVSSCFLYI